MKKITYFLLFLFAGIANSQNIVFDGTIFKNKLLESSANNSIARDVNNNNIKIDANNNGQISTAEASLVYKLNVSNALIPNMTGISSFVNVRELHCNSNIFETIDVSNLYYLESLDVSNNANLLSIFAKNGSDEIISFGTSNPNLVYICQDEDFIVEDLSSLLPNYVINSYSTIPPGGNYNTITGKLLFDNDENGNINDATDFQAYMKVKCLLGDDTVLYTTTNSEGNYFFYTPESYQGVYSVIPVLDAPNAATLFDPLVAAVGTIAGINQTYTHNILLTVGSQAKHDYEIAIMPIVLPVPGQQAVYDIVYRNKGSKKVDSDVEFRIFQSPATLASWNGNTTLPIISNGYYKVSFTDLMPFERRKIRIVLNVESTASIGQILRIDANLYQPFAFPIVVDPYLTDNSFTLNQTIVSSNVGNRIDCLQGNNLPTSQIGEYLHYSINIENLALADANFAVAKAVFDPAKFNLNSLQILSSFASNPQSTLEYDKFVVQIKDEEALFQLRNVMQGGEPGGQGGILFKIKTLDDLPSGSTVGEEIKLFFDYNYDIDINPVVLNTNNALTTFQNLSVAINTVDKSISIYPNPASTIIGIRSNSIIQSVELYDVYGRLLQTNLSISNDTTFDISQRVEGTYFLKITSKNGQKVEKVIKN